LALPHPYFYYLGDVSGRGDGTIFKQPILSLRHVFHGLLPNLLSLYLGNAPTIFPATWAVDRTSYGACPDKMPLDDMGVTFRDTSPSFLRRYRPLLISRAKIQAYNKGGAKVDVATHAKMMLQEED
jgi:hypothetical protein